MLARSARRLVAARGGHGGPTPPTFQRLPVPKGPVHEEYELLWDDGVAPELALDFDAPHVSKTKGLAMWLGGLSFFGLVGLVVWLTDPAGRNPATKRVLPYDGLARELGTQK